LINKQLGLSYKNASFRIRELVRPTRVIPVKVLMSNNLAQKTSVLLVSARAWAHQISQLELTRQVSDCYSTSIYHLVKGKRQTGSVLIERTLPGKQGPSSPRITNGETGVLARHRRAVRTGEDALLSTNHSEVERQTVSDGKAWLWHLQFEIGSFTLWRWSQSCPLKTRS